MGIHADQSDGCEPQSVVAENLAEKPERERDEGELVRVQDQLAALESTLADQARIHSDLIHLLAHELRTPITVIMGFSRLLLDPRNGPLLERQAGFVNQSLKACGRLNLLVGDLLDASPESESPLSVEIVPADLDDLIGSTAESLSPLMEERRIGIEFDLDRAIPALAFDPIRIEQVLTNLLTNAIRYGRPNGLIRVGRFCNSPGESEVVIYVEDDGPGIAEVDRGRVFEPYVRGSSHSDCAGMGIGLAICRRIVVAHSGSICVEESAKGGARFVFTLPTTPTTPTASAVTEE